MPLARSPKSEQLIWQPKLHFMGYIAIMIEIRQTEHDIEAAIELAKTI